MTAPDDRRPLVRTLTTRGLSESEVVVIRHLMSAAFGDDPDERFEDADWEHAIGGSHVVVTLGDEIVSHASVVERELRVSGTPIPTGYVEAVATRPDVQGRGYGSLAMTAIGRIIEREFALGALGTGSHAFYERLGWQTWRGPALVRTPGGDKRTPDDEGYIMILRTSATPAAVPADLDAPISCDWRPGDVW